MTKVRLALLGLGAMWRGPPSALASVDGPPIAAVSDLDGDGLAIVDDEY